MIASDAWDVVILGSGIAGLAGALAAHELGLRPLVLEKAGTLGGGTVHSYGLIWVGQNHLAEAAGYRDTREGRCEMRPLAETIRQVAPTAELYNWRPEAPKRADVSLAIYLNRTTIWVPDPSQVPPSERPLTSAVIAIICC